MRDAYIVELVKKIVAADERVRRHNEAVRDQLDLVQRANRDRDTALAALVEWLELEEKDDA